MIWTSVSLLTKVLDVILLLKKKIGIVNAIMISVVKVIFSNLETFSNKVTSTQWNEGCNDNFQSLYYNGFHTVVMTQNVLTAWGNADFVMFCNIYRQRTSLIRMIEVCICENVRPRVFVVAVEISLNIWRLRFIVRGCLIHETNLEVHPWPHHNIC